MMCVCKSKPNYHREDCPLFQTDGTPKPIVNLEKRFNEEFEKYIGDVIPFYFKLQNHSSYYKLESCRRKIDGEYILLNNVHYYTKVRLKNFCDMYFSKTGMRITFQ